MRKVFLLVIKSQHNTPTKDQSLKESRCCRKTSRDAAGIWRTAKPLVTGISTL